MTFFLISFILCLISYNPFILSLSIIMMSVGTSVFCWWVCSKWLSVVVFLVFVGGMMVVFFYATSLSKNEKVYFPMNKTGILAVVISILIMQILPLNLNTMPNSLANTMFSSNSAGVLIFLVFYLLVVLFVLVKISESFKGAIKLNKWL